jgi:uncharacterized protein YkwD
MQFLGGNMRLISARRIVGATAVSVAAAMMSVLPGATTAPASAACLVSVIPSVSSLAGQSAQLAAIDYSNARVVAQSRRKARARGRANLLFNVTATVTTTITLDTCLLGLSLPVSLSETRTVSQSRWASSVQDRLGYGARRRIDARNNARDAASAQAQAIAVAGVVEQARAAAYDAALGTAVARGLLSSADGYRAAVVSDWAALANQTRTARGLGPVRFVQAFNPLATDWAQTIHSSYDSRMINGTIHDAGFWRDLTLGGCTGGFRSGEIIAQVWRSGDPRRAAKDALDAWMASPSHRAILLDGRYTMSGIGIEVSGDWITLVGRFRDGSCALS